MRFFIAEVKQTISRMVSVESKLRAVRRDFTFGTHEEVFVAAVAKLVFTLSASEMHAAAAGQIVSEFAFRTIDAIQFQMLRNPLSLYVGVVRLFPLCKHFTR